MFISLPICFSLAICVRILQSRTIALAPRGLPARCQPAPARSPRRVLLGMSGNGSGPPESKRRKESGLPCTSSNRRWDVEHWRSVLWKCSPASFWRAMLPRGSLPASSSRAGGTQGWGQSQTLAAWGPTTVTAQPRVGFTASAGAVHGWRKKAWHASSQSKRSRTHQEGDTLPSASSASLWLLTAAPGSRPLLSRKN